MPRKCTLLWWREAHFEVKRRKAHCSKSPRRCAFQSVKTVNNCRFGALLVVEMSRKCTLLWREAHFEVKMLKAPHARTFLDVRSLFCVTGAGESAPCQTRGFCSSFKNDGRRGAFEKDLQRCMSRGRSSTRDMFIRDVRRSGR